MNGAVVGGFKLYFFKRSLRVMNVFILKPYQKKGIVKKLLLNIFNQYQKPIFTRCYLSMQEYWQKYGVISKNVSQNVIELNITPSF